MPKKPIDLNKLAHAIVVEATTVDTSTKNLHAVELGRRGGLKGGKARAASLSKARRKEIARLAAQARWRNKNR